MNVPWFHKGEEFLPTEWVPNKFYFVKPVIGDVLPKDAHIWGGHESEAGAKSKPGQAQPLKVQFYRSEDPACRPKERQYQGVWKDKNSKEDWTNKTRRNYKPFVIDDCPRAILDLPFDLEDDRIPLRVWDELDQANIFDQTIGGPVGKRTARAKRHPDD